MGRVADLEIDGLYIQTTACFVIGFSSPGDQAFFVNDLLSITCPYNHLNRRSGKAK
jgi:hypothetical protein